MAVETDPAEIPHADSKFLQQRLCACRPFLTPCGGAVVYAVFAVVALVIGFLCHTSSKDLWEESIRYDHLIPEGGTGYVSFEVSEDIKAQLYVFYELSGLHQNSFMYGSSKNWDQLQGEKPSESSLDRCEPVLKMGDAVLAPCGALPRSVFNDSYTFDSGFPSLTSKGIAIESFAKLFKPTNEEYAGPGAWIRDPAYTVLEDQNDERFVNWVQIAPFANFRKLWAKTEGSVELKKGAYRIHVTNNYPVASFGGKKSIVIGEVSWTGSPNRFLGVFLFVMCGLNGVLSILCIMAHVFSMLPLYRSLKQSEELDSLDAQN
jgi:hypothetical protein